MTISKSLSCYQLLNTLKSLILRKDPPRLKCLSLPTEVKSAYKIVMAENPTYTTLNPCHIALSQSTICEYESIKTFAKITRKKLKRGETSVLVMPSVAFNLTEQEYNCKLGVYVDMLHNDEYFKSVSAIFAIHEKTPPNKTLPNKTPHDKS